MGLETGALAPLRHLLGVGLVNLSTVALRCVVRTEYCVVYLVFSNFTPQTQLPESLNDRQFSEQAVVTELSLIHI